jgi:SAM-dependent methyltransferase
MLKEEEIRPRDLMAGLAVEIEADRLWLLDRAAQFVLLKCPVCGSTGTLSFEKKGFQYERCGKCRTAFMNPRPSQTVLHQFYEQSKTYAYWNAHIFPQSEAVRREKIFVPRAERVIGFCKKYGTSTRAILEIGAGFGTFCEEIQSRKVFERVIALEMTPDLAASCRSRGLEVLEQPVESLSIPEQSIDVIAAFETLEHLYSPKDFLTACHRLLAKNGLLVITCPSIDGFDVVTLGVASDTIDHEHVNYLNPDSISQLATECGFDVAETLTPGKLDADIVRNKVLEGQFSLDEQPWLKHVLIDQWDIYGEKFQEFLAANKLSTHMWMVATRR